jgi:hypothetical protein
LDPWAVKVLTGELWILRSHLVASAQILTRALPGSISGNDWTQFRVTLSEFASLALITVNTRIGHLFFKFYIFI